jgi:hypothetical protein
VFAACEPNTAEMLSLTRARGTFTSDNTPVEDIVANGNDSVMLMAPDTPDYGKARLEQFQLELKRSGLTMLPSGF